MKGSTWRGGAALNLHPGRSWTVAPRHPCMRPASGSSQRHPCITVSPCHNCIPSSPATLLWCSCSNPATRSCNYLAESVAHLRPGGSSSCPQRPVLWQADLCSRFVGPWPDRMLGCLAAWRFPASGPVVSWTDPLCACWPDAYPVEHSLLGYHTARLSEGTARAQCQARGSCLREVAK